MSTSHPRAVRIELAAALCLALGCTLASAQTPAASASAAASASTANLSHSDKKFVEQAAEGGMAEVELSRVAQQHATNPQVKQFADHMVTDHTKANQELTTLAGAKGLTPPPTLSHSHQKDLDKLAKETGADFDKAYIKDMVADHKKTVSLFEKEAKSGDDADLRAFAAKTLPTLRQHSEMAQSIEKAVK